MLSVLASRRIPAESLIPPLLALALFHVVATFGWVYFDDPAYYAGNPLLGEAPLLTRLAAAWTVAPESNWMPCTWTIVILLNQLFDGSAQAVHVVSAMLHSLNAWLVYCTIHKLGAKSLVAVVCACIWALHPLRVESVAWASSLKDVLSGTFAIGTLLVLANDRRDWKNDWLAFFFFLASLLSKQVMIAFPAALLLWDYQKTGHSFRALVLARLKWWAAALGATLIVWNVNRHGISLHEIDGVDTLGERIFRGFAAFGHQFQQFIIPKDLLPEYLIEAATLPKAVLGGLGLSAALVALVALRNKRGGTACWCFVAAVGLFFPFAGWVHSPMEFTADRLSYLPHCLAIAAIGLKIQNFRFTHWALAPFAIAAAMISSRELPSWKNGETLNQAMLAVRPGHPTALENRGVARAGRGDLRGAIDDFLAVTQTHPQRMSAWTNAARALAAKGEFTQSALLLDNAIRLHPVRTELKDLRQAIGRAAAAQSLIKTSD